MILYYSVSDNRYNDTENKNTWVSKSDFFKMLKSGKLVKLKNVYFLGIDAKFLYAELKYFRLRSYDQYSVGYYCEHATYFTEMITITRRSVVNNSDIKRITDACDSNPDYSWIFFMLDSRFPYWLRAVNKSGWYMYWGPEENIWLSSEKRSDVNSFMSSIYHFLKTADDNQRCYYALKCQEYYYPTVQEILSTFEPD